MQSPNNITPVTPEPPDYRNRALGCLGIVAVVLALPVVAALLLYLMTVAVWSYHSFVAALNGAF